MVLLAGKFNKIKIKIVERSSIMNFLKFTDAHLTGQNPENRTDVYHQSILNKIGQIYSYAEENKSDFVLFGGDLCNTHKIYSYYVIESFIDIIKKHKIPTYFIVGQHDLYGYEASSYKDSALRFIEKMSDGLFIRIEDKIVISDHIKTDIDCIIYASHSYDNYKERFDAVVAEDRFKIMLMHELLSKKENVFEIIKTSDLKSNADLVLSGDLHTGYELHTIGNTTYYNPGAIARIKNNDNTRQLKFGDFTITKGEDGYDISLKEVKLNYPVAEEVFNMSEPERDDVPEYGEFVEQIANIEKNAVDIFELIELVFNTQKDYVIDKKVINYILKFRKNEK